MQITTSLKPQISSPQVAAQVRSQVGPEELSTPSESFVSSSAKEGYRWNNSDLVPTLIIGGIGLAGMAVGGYAGAHSGVVSGLLGSVVGASAGASLGLVTPGEHIGLGAVGGAIVGTLVGSMGGNMASSIALGLAGATIPMGLLATFAAGR